MGTRLTCFSVRICAVLFFDFQFVRILRMLVNYKNWNLPDRADEKKHGLSREKRKKRKRKEKRGNAARIGEANCKSKPFKAQLANICRCVRFLQHKAVSFIATPTGWLLVQHSVRLPQQFAGIHLYTWMERGTARVKCLLQEQNETPQSGLELAPLDQASSAVTIRPPRLPLPIKKSWPHKTIRVARKLTLPFHAQNQSFFFLWTSELLYLTCTVRRSHHNQEEYRPQSLDCQGLL